jgi:glycosyltransferase involved in cell wall biosynthesis
VSLVQIAHRKSIYETSVFGLLTLKSFHYPKVVEFNTLNCNRVAFVIPCFNDGLLLASVLDNLPKESTKVVVDDGSFEKVSSSLGVDFRNDKLWIIEHAVNLGQGAALETGFEFIRRNCKHLECDFIVTFDSDGQHQIEDVFAMLRLLYGGNEDIVLGSRFLGDYFLSDFSGGVLKGIILKFSAFIARVTLGIRVTDRHNGLRVFSIEALWRIRITQNGYGHADEILREIKRNQLKFIESKVNILYPEFASKRGQSLLNAFNIVFKRFMGAK